MDARWTCPAALHDCFPRREPRGHGFDALGGQGRQRARTAIAPMALHGAGGTIRGLQRCRRDGRWEEAQRLWHAPQRVVEALGAPDGVLRVEATGCVKKGKAAGGAPGTMGAPWARGSRGRGAGGRARPRGLARPWWPSAACCRRWACRRRMPPDGPRARAPRRSPGSASRRGRRRWGRPSCVAGSGRARPWWRRAARRRALLCATPWRRVAAGRRWAQCLRTPAAGSSVPAPRPRPLALQGTSAPSVGASPPRTPHAPWRRGRRAGRWHGGSSARSRQARTGPCQTPGPVNASRGATAGLPERPVWLGRQRPLGRAPP